MDDGKCAITAIGDVRLEGSVAASLYRLGWQVVSRATSKIGLQTALSQYPEALVISSDDFRALDQVKLIRHLSLPSLTNPLSDNEFRELLRKTDQPQGAPTRVLAPTHSQIFLIASNGRTIGASTIALNFAQELSQSTGSTLLLDCNPWSPYLARHLSINGINREIARTTFGFSVGEIHGRESLSLLASTLVNFDRIVIDYGQIRNPGTTAMGRRAHEELLSWALHSQTLLALISRSDKKALDDAARIIEEVKQISPTLSTHALLTLTSILSGRERTRLIANSSSCLGTTSSLISRDNRSVLEMEAQGSTFSVATPKSLLLGELRELIGELA